MSNIMWHYCSLDSFLKIITTRTIKFSNILSTNDKSELNYFLSKLGEIEKHYNYFMNNLLCYNGFYSFSLSRKKDDLYMWMAYANDGVAIGFDIEYLKNEFSKYYNIEIKYGDVEYSNVKNIKEYIDDKLAELKEINKGKKFQKAGYTDFLEKSYFVKNDVFKLEEEYRFIFAIGKNENIIESEKNSISKEYTTNIYTGITDYFKLPFDKKCIKGLYVSPKSKLSNDDATKLMEGLGYTLDFIHNSDLSIR